MKLTAILIPSLLLFLSVAVYWHCTSVSEADYQSHFSNKVVLLCGTGFGIGEPLAYELAKQGAKLLLVTRTERKVNTLHRMAEKYDIGRPAILQVEKLMVARTGSKLRQIKANALELGSPQVEILYSYDFANVTDAHTIVDKTIDLLGGLDYLVLNHGEIPRGFFLEVAHQQTPESIDRNFGVNVFSFIEIALKAMPYLEQNKGHIFVTSSMLGEVPNARLPIFSATKHALNGFFYSLQQELTAKKSSVTLSIGALGEIGSENMMGVFKLPSWIMAGDVTECVRGIMDSLISRPRTFTYPKFHSYIVRLMWYFLPN